MDVVSSGKRLSICKARLPLWVISKIRGVFLCLLVGFSFFVVFFFFSVIMQFLNNFFTYALNAQFLMSPCCFLGLKVVSGGIEEVGTCVSF